MTPGSRSRALFLWLSLAACSGELSLPTPSAAPVADRVDPVAGVVDPGADPAVVLVERDGQILCAATLLAEDVVLTAARCLSDASCADASPAMPPPSSLVVCTGDRAAVAIPRAHVRRVALSPSASSSNAGACAETLALLSLDTAIDDVEPLVVRATGAAKGDHLRTVEYGMAPDGAIEKIVRDHVLVSQATTDRFALDETACQVGCGGPAIDPVTAEMTGVLVGSAAASGAAAPVDVALRTDEVLPWIAAALSASAGSGSAAAAKTKKGAIDFGADCAAAADCAAGVCVTQGLHRYCSEACDPADRCPTHSRCEVAGGGWEACVED